MTQNNYSALDLVQVPELCTELAIVIREHANGSFISDEYKAYKPQFMHMADVLDQSTKYWEFKVWEQKYNDLLDTLHTLMKCRNTMKAIQYASRAQLTLLKASKHY